MDLGNGMYVCLDFRRSQITLINWYKTFDVNRGGQFYNMTAL